MRPTHQIVIRREHLLLALTESGDMSPAERHGWICRMRASKLPETVSVPCTVLELADEQPEPEPKPKRSRSKKSKE